MPRTKRETETAKIRRRIEEIHELAGNIDTGSYMSETARKIERRCRQVLTLLESRAKN